MPGFELEAACAAPPSEVWKLLHDPSRFPEWWAGLARVEPGDGESTFYRAAWPDFAYPTLVAARQEGRSIVVSCQVSDIEHEWVLEPAGGGCAIRVRVACPEPRRRSHLVDCRAETEASLPRLVALAEASR